MMWELYVREVERPQRYRTKEVCIAVACRRRDERVSRYERFVTRCVTKFFWNRYEKDVYSVYILAEEI